jgi:ABC-type glycerol-3-phosphate transport system substrate-binding protein
MLDALSTASAAAPLALPDLVALPRSLLESAALKGLLHPFDGFTSALDASDWYTYARQLALLENSQFGFPFAGDVLLVVYHPSALPQPPLDWNTTLAISSTLAFPASDPQALFTLALYQSLGGPVRDEQGRPVLDAQTLEQVFDFYARAGEGGQMPYWLAQYETDGQIWDALVQKQAPMAITWASHYLARSGEQSLDLAVSQLPTLEGRPFTLATGWVWALASTRPERQELSAALAEFLVEPLFLSRWTAAAGFFPTRADALPAWSALHPDPAISAILLSASLYPPADVLTVLGPILQQSVVEVLKQQATPPDAARTAIERLNAP